VVPAGEGWGTPGERAAEAVSFECNAWLLKMLDLLRTFRVEDRRQLYQRPGEFDVIPVLHWLAGRGFFGQEIMRIWP
jgi:hypothetical protein